MAEPFEADKNTPSFKWYLRPMPLWALGAVAVAAALGIWSEYFYRSGDAKTTPARWATLLDEDNYLEDKNEERDDHNCFISLTDKEKIVRSQQDDTLTNSTSSDPCFHLDIKPIKPRPTDWLRHHVAVYSTPAPLNQTTSLRDLGDNGQAEAIRFLEKDSGPKGGAWTALRAALQSNPRAGERDPFRFDRILIANVAKGINWKPGDRMMWTRVLIEPINFSFAGYSVAATENETLNVASVERMNSRKFSTDLSATIPGMEGPKASLGSNGEHSLKTNSDVKAQYEKLGIDIMPNFLRIIRGKRERRRRSRQHKSCPNPSYRSRNDLETSSEGATSAWARKGSGGLAGDGDPFRGRRGGGGSQKDQTNRRVASGAGAAPPVAGEGLDALRRTQSCGWEQILRRVHSSR